jgi:hypothetical protein
MALITKPTVASVLGIADADLPQSVYDWAVAIFYKITDLRSADTQRTHREFVSTSRMWIKLPDSNIKQIDTLKIDNVTTAFTLFTDLKFNPDTGLVNYSGGFSGGQLVEITYTINAATLEAIHDYLVTLLATKGLSIFTPSKLGQVKMVKIGKYQKQFSNVADDLDSFIKSLDMEIMDTVGVIAGDDGRMKFGSVV